MPIDLHIIRASEFVRLDAHEQLDFEASKRALALLAQACRKRGLDRALLDLRELPIPPKPIFTREELTALVATFREAGFTRRQKLAVLYRTDPHRGARIFTFISILRGWRVSAFRDFEQALFWLSQEDQKTRPDPGEQEVPIQFAKRKVVVKPKTRNRPTAK